MKADDTHLRNFTSGLQKLLFCFNIIVFVVLFVPSTIRIARKHNKVED